MALARATQRLRSALRTLSLTTTSRTKSRSSSLGLPMRVNVATLTRGVDPDSERRAVAEGRAEMAPLAFPPVHPPCFGVCFPRHRCGPQRWIARNSHALHASSYALDALDAW